MRLFFCGDIVGRSGREAFCGQMPMLRERLRLDFVVVNGENAAAGFGITEKICTQFLDAGADVVTGGNHSWAQQEALSYHDREPRLLRPMNYPEGAPGRGAALFDAPNGRKILVMNAMAHTFMPPLDDPFASVRRVIERVRMGRDCHAAILDFHGEATSEKMAMGHYLDGKVSLVVGTHTHIPTADHQILPKGTAYQTDAGMVGDYDSVIGMDKEALLHRFTRKIAAPKMTPAKGEATLCGLYVETDDKTGLGLRLEPLRVGGRLSQVLPDLA